MLSLTALFFLIEITVGYVTNSMALVADSFHMLSDVIALLIAYVSVRMSPKKWSKNTFGWARAEVLGALVNAVFLCALCFSILVESIKRFYKPETIHDAPVILVVGVSGLIINVIGLFLFKGECSPAAPVDSLLPPSLASNCFPDVNPLPLCPRGRQR